MCCSARGDLRWITVICIFLKSQHNVSSQSFLESQKVMNCPSPATFLGAQDKWGWMGPLELSSPTSGPKKLIQELWQATPHSIYFLTKRRNFLPLFHIIHNVAVPSCSPVVTGHKQSWVQQMTTQKSCWDKDVAVGWSHTHLLGNPPSRRFLWGEKLQVTIPRTNQLPCPVGQKL